MNRLQLENRLIQFSLKVLTIVESMGGSDHARHLSNQLGRSGTSVSLNYGEACEAESRKDFIHKMKIVLKELRETNTCLRIIKEAKLHKCSTSKLVWAITENNELISIFVISVATARKRHTRARKITKN